MKKFLFLILLTPFIAKTSDPKQNPTDQFAKLTEVDRNSVFLKGLNIVVTTTDEFGSHSSTITSEGFFQNMKAIFWLSGEDEYTINNKPLPFKKRKKLHNASPEEFLALLKKIVS